MNCQPRMRAGSEKVGRRGARTAGNAGGGERVSVGAPREPCCGPCRAVPGPTDTLRVALGQRLPRCPHRPQPMKKPHARGPDPDPVASALATMPRCSEAPSGTLHPATADHHALSAAQPTAPPTRQEAASAMAPTLTALAQACNEAAAPRPSLPSGGRVRQGTEPPGVPLDVARRRDPTLSSPAGSSSAGRQCALGPRRACGAPTGAPASPRASCASVVRFPAELGGRRGNRQLSGAGPVGARVAVMRVVDSIRD